MSLFSEQLIIAGKRKQDGEKKMIETEIERVSEREKNLLPNETGGKELL